MRGLFRCSRHRKRFGYRRCQVESECHRGRPS
nr:MAG TPA: hypothetical protein [Caudoviricetes sp.]